MSAEVFSDNPKTIFPTLSIVLTSYYTSIAKTLHQDQIKLLKKLMNILCEVFRRIY